jgi:hypothetical protein
MNARRAEPSQGRTAVPRGRGVTLPCATPLVVVAGLHERDI